MENRSQLVNRNAEVDFIRLIVHWRALIRAVPSSTVRRTDDELDGPHVRRGGAMLDVADARESGNGWQLHRPYLGNNDVGTEHPAAEYRRGVAWSSPML